jgi:hypothetical protein
LQDPDSVLLLLTYFLFINLPAASPVTGTVNLGTTANGAPSKEERKYGTKKLQATPLAKPRRPYRYPYHHKKKTAILP